MSTNKDETLIFISWSGETTRRVALALRELLANTIQTALPWMSESDIDKGARWRSEIEQKLEAAQAGIIVLASDNLTAPWLLFEAGALSKKGKRVCTYLVGLTKGQQGDPLAQFQATSITKDDTLAMAKSINRALGESGVDEGRMVKAFDRNWVEFETALQQAPPSSVASPPPPDPVEMLQVALSYLREHSEELTQLKQAVALLSMIPGSTAATFGLYDPTRPVTLSAYKSSLYENPGGTIGAPNVAAQGLATSAPYRPGLGTMGRGLPPGDLILEEQKSAKMPPPKKPKD
jgi:hypothetical protein